MGNKITLQEAILDAMADDDESIVQITNCVRRWKRADSPEQIKRTLIDQVKEGFVLLAYPPGAELVDFEVAEGEREEIFWFRLTEKGRIAQQNIECEFEDDEE